MLLGTPVITSNTASIPEVAGDAAIMVNPYDTRAIAGAIIALDNDADLRASLSAKGFERAKLFSEDVYRERLKGAYEKFI
jgi:glycosyltransferase involved in cell wall biosynthesis